MATCRNLWYYTPIFSVDIDLRMDDITKKPLTIFDDSGSGFITAAFDSQNLH
jgi:hypothetical protein